MNSGGKIGGGETNKVLSQIATSIVAEKASENMKESLTNTANSEFFQEDEDDLDSIRKRRMMELKKSRQEMQENISVRGHGEYSEVTQDEFLPNVTGSKQVVCHFYHKDFQRCKIFDHHLRIIAKMHPETKFICINAEKAPFFVERLAIRTLPTLLFFIDGINFERIIGFEGISKKDDFKTGVLAKRLFRSDIIKISTTEDSDSEEDD